MFNRGLVEAYAVPTEYTDAATAAPHDLIASRLTTPRAWPTKLHGVLGSFEPEKECGMTAFRAANHQRTRDLRLTPDLVSIVARKVEDAGPAPGVVVHNDADYEASLQTFLAAGPWHGQDVWVFAYGSLLWNPAFEVAKQVPAVLPGWHRAFCIQLTRFRGTPDQPGLMMSLTPGGSCRGALLRITGNSVESNLRKLWRREMTVKPPNTPPRWVTAKAGGVDVRAIVFAANRRGANFVAGLTNEQVADVLCKAAGHWGSGAEYLMQTVDQLEGLGIRDANLWRLQRLVAQQLVSLRTTRQKESPSTPVELVD